jgi:hypothetical protein
MSISSVGSSTGNAPIQQAPEAAEVKKVGGDNDGDSDDRGAKAAQAPLAPSVNTSGQKIGQVINVRA